MILQSLTQTIVLDIIIVGENMEYKELDNKSALNKVKGGFPYIWDLNIYRGCEHKCKYCFAIYTHDYLEDNYFETIYYKKNILECLEKELSSPNWKREVVNIGGVTDSYQPLEKELKIMPEVLKLMIKYKTPIIISTKSKLILRDIELIKELAEITTVNIACTITTPDEKLREALEPNGASSIDRFKVLNEIKAKTKATIGVHIMPVIPYLTDDYNNLKAIYRTAKKINADYVLPGALNLRGKTKPYFLDFVKDYNIDIYNKINALYPESSAGKEYNYELYKKINKLEKEYNMSSDYRKGLR